MGSVSGSAGDPVEVDVVLGEGNPGGSRPGPLGEVELQVNGYLVAQEHTGYSKCTKPTENAPVGKEAQHIFQTGLNWLVDCGCRLLGVSYLAESASHDCDGGLGPRQQNFPSKHF